MIDNLPLRSTGVLTAFVLLGLVGYAHAGRTTISAEALVTPDNQMLWGLVVNRAPGDGAAAEVNPPRFRWFYVPDIPHIKARDPALGSLIALYKFRFQIADEPTFASPIVDVVCDYNCYNALSPLPEGKTYYWRVGYMCQMLAPDGVRRDSKVIAPRETTPSSWSDIRSFTIAPGTPVWDRSALAEPKLGPHPRMPFRKDQLAQLRRLVTTDSHVKEIFEQSIVPTAQKMTQHAYWDSWPKTDTDKQVRGYYFTGKKLMQTALAYVITGEAKYRNIVDIWATIASYPPGGRSSPEGMGGDNGEDSTSLTEFLALAYDWFYDELTDPQREAFEESLQWRIDKWMHEFQWGGALYRRVNTPTYSGPAAGMSSLMLGGGGHSWEGTMATLPAAIAIYEKSPLARKFFHIVVNYLIGVGEITTQFGGYDLGCSYGQSHLKWFLYQTMYINSALPQLQIHKNPYYRHVGRYFVALVPVGLPSAPWGRIDSQGAGVMHRREIFRLLGYLVGDGVLLANWTNAGGDARYGWRQWVHMAAPLHLDRKLTPQIGEQTEFFFPLAGFAMSHTYPPTDPRAFKEGAGVIFRSKGAPPGGGAVYFNESAFQFYAYGQLINFGGGTGGAEPHGFHTMSHNTVLIDGLGQAPHGPDRWQIPYGSVMMAHKTGEQFTYWMADATMCYPRTPAPVASWVVRFDPKVYGKKAVPYLERFRRHILFVRKKYVVVFDDLVTAPDHPGRFSWLWHVLQKGEATFDKDTARVTYPAGDVKVILQHVANVGAIEYQNLQDLDGLANPITGEDFRNNKHTQRELGREQWRKYVPHHNMWFTNRAPASRFHFMTVIYPTPPGGGEPKITRLDDYTVEVAADGTIDVISFDPETQHPATLVVDLPVMRKPLRFEGR